MQRVDSDKLKHYLRDDVYGHGVDDLLAAGSDEGGISERFAGPSAFSSLPAETSSMMAGNNSNQGVRQGESTGASADGRQDGAQSKSKSGLLPPMPQLQRPEHLLVTSEQGHPSQTGVDGPRPVHKAHPVPPLTHLPLLNPMGSSELLSSLPEGNSGLAQLPMPPPGSLPSGPSVDSSGLLKAQGTISHSKSLPRNGNGGSERFNLERVAQQHVLDLAVDNLSPPGSPSSRERRHGKGTRIIASDARGPGGLGPVTQLHRGGSLTNPPQVNSRLTHTSGPPDEPTANPHLPPATPPEHSSQEESDLPFVQLPPRPATALPARPMTHLPARPSTHAVAPLAIPSPSDSPAPAHSGVTSASPDPGASPYRSAVPTPGSDAASAHSSSAVSSARSRLRAPSGTSTSIQPSPGGDPSPCGSMLTPRGGQSHLMTGSRIPRSPAEVSSAMTTPAAKRKPQSLQATPSSRLSPSPMTRSRLPQPNGGKSPSMLPSRFGSASALSKASASPEFVAPRPRASILRGPSQGKVSHSLQTTTAELDKLAATLKQVQQDISLSMPSSSSQADAARPEQKPNGTPSRDREPRRNVLHEAGAGAAVRKPSPARQQHAKEAAARPEHPRVNGEAVEVREPLAEVTNGAQIQEPVPRDVAISHQGAEAAHEQSTESADQQAYTVPAFEPAACAAAVAEDVDPVAEGPAVPGADAESTDEDDAIARAAAIAAEKARRKKKREQRREKRREQGKEGEKPSQPHSKKSSSKAKTASSSNKKKPKSKDLAEPEPVPPKQPASRWCCFA